jgi:hypothetical protein
LQATEKLIPLKGCNLDYSQSNIGDQYALFIKNLVYELGDSANANTATGSQMGVFKPCQANEPYVPSFVLPGAVTDNSGAGAYESRLTRQAFVLVYNKKSNHTLYRIDGRTGTMDVVYQGSFLNVQQDPKYFMHAGGAYLWPTKITDPDTGLPVERTFFFYTDGFNFPRFFAVEDAIATKGFTAFNYFNGNFDTSTYINMGLPTPVDCIQVSEIPFVAPDVALNNNLLFNTWQFRLRHYDVWGRMSEYGMISDMYIPGGNNCIDLSSSLPRCVNLTFPAPSPLIDKVEIAYRNCNSTQWYREIVLNLYSGSPLGEWWLRPRNPVVNYNSVTSTITYPFCAAGECVPIDPNATNRLQNAIPKVCQSLTNVGKFLCLADNVDGFLPFDETLLSKIKFIVEPPVPTPETNNFGNIEIFVEIYSPFNQTNSQVILKDGKFWFSNALFAFEPIKIFEANYNQFFANPNQAGFYGYLSNGASTISEEYELDQNGNLTKVTNFTQFVFSSKYFQKFTFTNVQRGQYVFRIGGITVDPTVNSAAQCQASSTYTAGLFGFNFATPANPVNHNLNFNDYAKELVVDICTENYSSLTDNKILVIYDFMFSGAPVVQGYVYNTNDSTQSQYGIELLHLTGAQSYNSFYTDHNGYYFVAEPINLGFRIIGLCNCKNAQLAAGAAQGPQQSTLNFYLNLIIPSNLCPDYSGSLCNFVLVTGFVKLCDGGIGVPGVQVTLSRGKTVTTDENGEFQIIAYDDIANGGGRNDTLYFASAGCVFTACDGSCIPPMAITFQRCITCTTRTLTVTDTIVTFFSARGLLSGGVYPVGVMPSTNMGKCAFVQNCGYINIPSVSETKVIAPSKVRVTIDPMFQTDPSFAYLTFFIGTETTIEDYETWIVDSVEFIDNTGLINTVAPTQIKIFYQSLNEFNKQNNFNTTDNWQFLEPLPSGSTQTTQIPFTNDKVQFILNGDGTFFSKQITSLVKYDQTGQYFLINYTSDLAKLLPNAIIRLVRPKVCLTAEEPPMYEQCYRLDLKNGSIPNGKNSFYLNAFDTYYLNRQIPVPQILNPNTTIVSQTARVVHNPDGSTTTTTTTTNETVTQTNELRILGVPFEHNSPSDFWGQDCANLGRENTKNPYETELHNLNQFALSGALSPTGQLNFLNYFDESVIFNFDTLNIGGVYYIIGKTGFVFALGQYGSFKVGFNDTIARVDASGNVIAPSTQDTFGQPERTGGGDYGCQAFDKNTISEKDGLLQFLDSSKGMVISHNFNDGAPYKNVDSYVRVKVKIIQQFNLTAINKRYWVGLVNPINNEYILTDYQINSNSFANTLRDFDFSQNDTIAFGILSKYFKGSYSFTPEYYATLEGELNDSQLFAIANGIPYRHYSVNNKTFNTFFGVTCNRVFRVLLNIDSLKKKKPLSLGVYCKQGVYFADQVLSEAGQQTRMLISQWLEAEFGWYAPFLCDLNTLPDPNQPIQTGVNVLMDGNMLTGTWIDIRLIGDPSLDNQYTELEGICVSAFPSEKSGK